MEGGGRLAGRSTGDVAGANGRLNIITVRFLAFSQSKMLQRVAQNLNPSYKLLYK